MRKSCLFGHLFSKKINFIYLYIFYIFIYIYIGRNLYIGRKEVSERRKLWCVCANVCVTERERETERDGGGTVESVWF